MGPAVSIEPDVLNFNDIPAGETVTRVFYLKNNATVPAVYHVFIALT